MKLKQGTNINGLKPELLIGIMIVNDYFVSINKELTITSVTDSKHGRGSLHYVGLAFDVRTWDFTEEEAQKVVDDLKQKLSIQFDVVLEKDHIHIEFQPK